MELKKNLEAYRIGAIGSLMDEYEKALFELKTVLRKVNESDYSRIVEGQDEHCRSIQVIMNHVVAAGRRYSNYIRDAISMGSVAVVERQIGQTEIANELDKMFAYTLEVFSSERQITSEEMQSVYFKSRWEIPYNIEQMLEHAIVHTLRHRRQIEKFLLQFESSKN